MTELILCLNPNPTVTLEEVEHLKKYGWKAYGYECTGEYALEQEFNRELGKIEKKISQGSAPNIYSDEVVFYDLMLDSQHVGYIALIPVGQYSADMTLAVFDEYSGRGVARKALELLLEEVMPVSWNEITATIRMKNPNRKVMIHLLETTGFRPADQEDFNTIWFFPLIGSSLRAAPEKDVPPIL